MACEACPCPDTCLAAKGAPPFGFFCEWAVGTPAQRNHVVVRSSLGWTPPPATPAPAPKSVAPASPAWMADAPPRAPKPEVDRAKLAAQLRAMKAVHACPHIGGFVNDCSCTGRRHCSLGKGTIPGEPTGDECVACVSVR